MAGLTDLLGSLVQSGMTNRAGNASGGSSLNDIIGGLGQMMGGGGQSGASGGGLGDLLGGIAGNKAALGGLGALAVLASLAVSALQKTGQAYKDGLRPLRLSGALKVLEGVTTAEEVLKAVPTD
jgi:hypothetical protein